MIIFGINPLLFRYCNHIMVNWLTPNITIWYVFFFSVREWKYKNAARLYTHVVKLEET